MSALYVPVLASALLVTGTPGNSAPQAGLTPARAEALWKDLADPDAEKAFRAIGTLTEHPREAVALLKEKLKPVAPADPGRLKRLVADLGSERYATREKATRELEELADLAAPALQQLLEGKPPVETQQRARRLLARLEGPITSPAMLAAFRGIEVLEHVGTPAARRALEALARGAPGHRITDEARASVGRLARQESHHKEHKEHKEKT
jgi:hypothetical protein